MGEKLFLEGDIGVGKSSLIRKALLPFLPDVGGFFVQRIFIGDRYVAFRFKEVRETAAYQLNKYVSDLSEMDDLFLFCDREGRWRRNLQVFAGRGSTCLKNSMTGGKSLILLDEMGGIELACPAFMEAIWEVLNGDIPVLGVLKSRRNVQKLRAGLVDPEKFDEIGADPLSCIENLPGAEVLHVSTANYPEISSRVYAFVEGVFACIR